MTRWWTKVVDKVWDHLVLDEPSPRKQVEERLEQSRVETAIEKARSEWMAAKAYFDNVTDPDLIDHAIYTIEAAERKYMYLLRHAEEFGYQTPPDPTQLSPSLLVERRSTLEAEASTAEKAGLSAHPL